MTTTDPFFIKAEVDYRLEWATRGTVNGRTARRRPRRLTRRVAADFEPRVS